MATSLPDESAVKVWSNIALQINETFDKIIWNANKRRNQLLKELENQRLAFEAQNKSVQNSISELENLVRTMEETGLRENLAVEIFKKSLIPIEENIQSLKSVLTPIPEFVYSCKYDLLSEISQLGTLVADREPSKKNPIEYKNKIKSFKSFGLKGSSEGELNNPQRIHFDSVNKTLFVVDLFHQCVQIFDEEGKFVSQFGQNVLKAPCGIATDGEYYNVTDVRTNSVFKFENSRDYLLVKQTSAAIKLNIPLSIQVFNKEVFVAERLNHKVSVFDTNLNFKHAIGVGRLQEPKTLEVYKSELYVIDRNKKNNLHVFTVVGDFLRASPSGMDNTGQMCFDRDGNMLVTDYGGENIQILSPTGDLVHKIGKGAPGTEAIGQCTGLALNGDTIIVAVRSTDHCIKFF